MGKRNRRLAHRISRRPPASGRRLRRRLTNQDVATSAAELLAFYQQFQDLFPRREQRAWWLLYLCGQLSNLERKTIEPMMLALVGPDLNAIRGMQHFVGQGEWAWTPFLERIQQVVADWLGEPDAVLIADGSGFPKQGKHSVGVAPQYCGHLGKVANSQEGAFVLYASRRGHALVDMRLYVPERWFTPEYQERWQTCGIPETLTFRTEPNLSLAMITDVVQRGELPFRWVTCDERYGEIPAFLDGIAALDKWYFAEMAIDTQVWLQRPTVESPGPGVLGRPRLYPRVSRTAPRPQTLQEVMKGLPARAWHVHVIKEGSKGPLVAEFAWLRVTPVRDKLPGTRCWVIFRRTLSPEPELKFFLSNAPVSCPPLEFVRVSGLRWPIETAFEEAKGEVGMDHYETRTWAGWHHHMTLSILSHLCLVRIQFVFKKKPGVNDRTGASTAGPSDRRRPHPLSRYHSALGVSPASKLRRLLFAPETHPCEAQAAVIQAPKTLIGAAQAEIS